MFLSFCDQNQERWKPLSLADYLGPPGCIPKAQINTLLTGNSWRDRNIKGWDDFGVSAKTREFTTKFTTKDALDPVTTLQIFMQKTDIEYSTFIISQKRIDVFKTYQRIN